MIASNEIEEKCDDACQGQLVENHSFLSLNTFLAMDLLFKVVILLKNHWLAVVSSTVTGDY